MNTAISEEQQALHAQIAGSEQALSGLQEQLHAVERELEKFSRERQQYDLLRDVCDALDKLAELGGEELFWEGALAIPEPANHLKRLRGSVDAFQQRIAGLDQNRKELSGGIRREQQNIQALHEEIERLRELEERRKYEFVVEREVTELPFRPLLMPWNKGGEDEKRFRKVLLLTLLFVMTFGLFTAKYTLPEPEPDQVVEIPERLVQLVKKQQPKPPQPREEKPKPQQEEEKVPDKEKRKPTPAEAKRARAKAEKSGVLAFKDAFADLMDDSNQPNLGVDARVTNAGKKAVGGAERSIVVAQARSGSGGINTSKLSRGVGGTGKTMDGVQFSRVSSAIGTEVGDAERPLSDGPGPSRTDEEIQIVFDRYKATLYRIYNRELRVNPTLQGKMVLRITIEPSGVVSACKVESTDLDSAKLSAAIVNRVKRFNFGPKEGVPKVTILYPIDFLPAS